MAAMRGRAVLMAVATVLALALSQGDGLTRTLWALGAAATAGLVLVAERHLRTLGSRALIGGTVGLFIGLAAALLAAAAASRTLEAAGLPPGLAPGLFGLWGAWLGTVVGERHSRELDVAAIRTAFSPSRERFPLAKVIDTSVIIDGRFTGVLEAGFVDGVIVVPRFILRELQQVADSSDSLKRIRGRKGLDALRAIQASDRAHVELTDRDFPEIREVDGKLISLAEELGAKVLTNDYNLAKVALLRGVEVLNVNDLANAVKPVVLPGESLSVQVIKEGKERNQGVGYLDDGTMVVVDNARQLIGNRVKATVTRLIQTNAGKMIFCAVDESEAAELLPHSRRPTAPASQASSA